MGEEYLENSGADWNTYNPGSHKDIKIVIRNNINSVCANYVAIGYYLNVVNDRKLYEEDGYSGIGEYAAAEYGIQEDKCSYLRKIAKRFCIPNSPALLPEYRDFKVEKLRAMVYLTDEQLEKVTITTTRAEIREMRNPEPEKVEPAQVEAEPDEPYWKKSIIQYPKRDEYIEQLALYFLRCFFNWFEADYFNRVLHVEHSEKEMKKKFTQPSNTWYVKMPDGELYHFNLFDDIIQVYSPSECLGYIEWFYLCAAVQRKYNTVAYERSNQQPETMNDQPETVDSEPETVNDVDVTVIKTSESVIEEPENDIEEPCGECRWGDISPNQVSGGGELPCIKCFWATASETDEDKFEPLDKSEPVETVEADIIQAEYATDDSGKEAGIKEVIRCAPTRNEDDPNCPAGMGPKRGGCTRTFADESFDEARDICKWCWDAYLRRLIDADRNIKEPVENEPVKPEQPELPTLRNNDQRKEWAENYKAWGEWYYDEHIDVHYYKYDFPNGDRLAVEEYRDREYYWAVGKRDEAHYHLLQKKKQAYGGTKTFEQKYMHQTSSMTEIVEYLKDIQKKGA